MENKNKEWAKFMLEIQKSTEIVDQLSKLYIVLHEKVRKTIVKCTLDPHFNPTQEAHQHLQIILDLLIRLSNPNDVYLRGVDASILNKYEQQLVDLSEQIQKLIQGQKMAQNHDAKQLIGLKHIDNRQKFGLKDEIRQSQNRILRSRSGKRRTVNKQKSDKDIDNDKLIQQFEAYKTEYLKKKVKLQKQIDNHIEKKGNQVIFSKKYVGDNLEQYFKLRKELLDLVLAQQHTKQIVNSPNIQNIAKNADNNEGFEQKIFDEFKIKTKYMKKHVKENILQALADVKIKLLQEYHASNIQKLNKGNPDTLVVLAKRKSKNVKSMTALPVNQIKINPISIKTQFQYPTNQTAKGSSSLNHKNKTASIFVPQKTYRYPMASKAYKPLVYQTGWNQMLEQGYLKGIGEKFVTYKVPN